MLIFVFDHLLLEYIQLFFVYFNLEQWFFLLSIMLYILSYNTFDTNLNITCQMTKSCCFIYKIIYICVNIKNKYIYIYIYIYKRLKWFVKQHQVHKTK